MSEYFCNDTTCPPAIGNVIVYVDDSHITSTYSRTLAPALSRKLAAVLPQDWYRDAGGEPAISRRTGDAIRARDVYDAAVHR